LPSVKRVSEWQNAFRSGKTRFGAAKTGFGARGWVGVCSASYFESRQQGVEEADRRRATHSADLPPLGMRGLTLRRGSARLDHFAGSW
jgi:hypothetical protein